MPIVGIEASSRRTVPDAPLIGTATNVGLNRGYNNGRADVTFSAPVFNGGLEITGYTVTAVEDPTKTASGASSPISVTGLLSNTNYTFKAYATNAIGTGVGSASSNQITATTVPQTPNAPTPSVPTGQAFAANANVNVAVNALATGGLPITAYGIVSSSGGTGSSATSTITISETRGTARTYTSTVTNNNGTSLASAASVSITPSTVPDAPATPSASAGIQQATITFSAPNDGSSAITSYTINNSLGGTRTGIAGSPYVWTGLTAGQSLSFTVQALNANGSGNFSPSSNTVTPSSPPVGVGVGVGVVPVGVVPVGVGVVPVGVGVVPVGVGVVPCVHGDTPVRTIDGYVKAKELFIGQKLISYTFDELPTDRDQYDVELWSTSSLSKDVVVETTIEAIKIRSVAVTAMFNNDKTRRFSLDHMILARRNDTYMFVQAGVIRMGDYLVYDVNNKATEVVVESIGYLDEIVDVYDISVTPYDLFIAGDVIAHNKKGLFQGPTKRDKNFGGN